MDYQKTFDELLDGILTDYRNQFPEVDTSQGSLVFIKSAVLASALWGLYQYQQWISRQIFPDTADSEGLQKHVWTRGLTPVVGETEAELLARLLSYIRRPPAGGNKYDYQRWALEIAGVAAAWSQPLGQGPGSVDVIVVADAVLTGSEIPSAELLAEVKAYIDEVRPVTAKYTRVLAGTFAEQDVTMVGSGVDWDPIQAALDVAAYLQGFVPDQVLYLVQLANIALQNGAEDVVITVPAANVVPAAGEILRSGVIDVT